MESLDNRIWSAVSKAVSDPDTIYDRLTAMRANLEPTVNEEDREAIKTRIRTLVHEESNLVAAIKAAPSGADTIGAELEKIARERKTLEGQLKAQTRRNGQAAEPSVDADAVKEFCQAMKPFLKAMAVQQRKELLSLLGFEATVSDTGEIKGSIAVPSGSNPIHHCTNMGMTAMKPLYWVLSKAL